MSKLPIKNDQGFFEIRLESIGGLGAHLAGKMLTEAGIEGLGLNGAHFSSYGSEKKGSPIKSFVRFGEGDIRISSPVERPHIVVVFHEALFKTIDVASGLYPNGVILVNTQKSPDEIRELLDLKSGTVAVVDALSISVEEKTRVNTALLGALLKMMDFLDPAAMKKVIEDTFGVRYPHLVESNIRTFDRGYNEVEFKTYEDDSGATAEFTRAQPLYGYETQPIGGNIINPGSSIFKDLSSSRQGFIPELDLEACIHCAKCDIVCPDLCFEWVQGEDKRGRPQMFLRGLDYQYCKGCLKCVEVCPTDALKTIREEEGYTEQHGISQEFKLESN